MSAIELGTPMIKACPIRVLTDQLADKWSICVVLALLDGPVRFNALKRHIEGITQKMLGQTLRRLETNGLVDRRAYATMPMRVEYEITPLGRTLSPIIAQLEAWAIENHAAVAAAREGFQDRSCGAGSTGIGSGASRHLG